MKINCKWEEIFNLPMTLHAQIIEELKDQSEDFSMASMKISLPIESAMVSFTLDTNENFNYLASDLKFKPE